MANTKTKVQKENPPVVATSDTVEVDVDIFEDDAKKETKGNNSSANEEDVVLIDALKHENATLKAQLDLHQKELELKTAKCESLAVEIIALKGSLENKSEQEKAKPLVSNLISQLHELLADERQKEILSLLHSDYIKLSYKDFDEKEKAEIQADIVARYFKPRLEGRVAAIKALAKK